MTKSSANHCFRAIMTASTLSLVIARQMHLHQHSLTSAALKTSRVSMRGCAAFARIQSSRRSMGHLLSSQSPRLPSAGGALSMAWYDDDGNSGETSSSSLPYSTSTSAAAPSAPAARQGSGIASAKSSLPFQAPRYSVDDSVPNPEGKLLDGALEWSKLGMLTDLVDAVARDVSDGGLGLSEGPTPVQKMAIPEILSGCKDRMASVENIKLKSEKAPAASSFDYDPTPSRSSSSSSSDQSTSIPPVRSVAFAAATGSGKTLSYLLPIIQSLRAQELMALTTASTSPSDSTSSVSNALSMETLSRLRRPRRPRAVVLAPTRELARQILSVLKSVGHTCKISSELLVGGDDYGTQRKRLANRPVDILVATPGRLVKHRDAGDIFLGSVRHVVIDEMDTMLEQGFQNDIGRLLHPMLYKKKVISTDEYKGGKLQLVEGAPQVILTTATMTPAVRRLLDRPDLPFAPKRVYGKKAEEKDEDDSPNNVKIALPRDIRVLTAPGLHRVVPRLKQVFVNVGSSDKLSLLVDVVAGGERQKREQHENTGGPLPLTLVFCNTVSSCRAAEHALAESGVPSLCYHGDLKSDVREENLRQFRKAGEGEDEGASVLVCSDIASRGLDVPQVDHVVMFDFPLNPIDYLHRAGRTARGLSGSNTNSNTAMKRGEGKVTALVTKRDRVLATAIEGAVQRGESLEGLSSRKSDYSGGRSISSMQGNNSGGRGGRSSSGGRGERGGRGRGRGGRSSGRGRR